MTTIIIPKKEYQQLLERALRYDYLRQIMEEDHFASPPTRSIKDIVRAFQKTKKYNQKFIENLKKGLKRSSYFRS